MIEGMSFLNMSQHQMRHFVIFMRDYDKITTKEDRKRTELVGERLDNAMNFNEMMIETK